MTISLVSPQEAAAELLKRRKARTNLLPFITYTMPRYEVNWHHEVMCRYVDKWVDREIRNIMFFMPPRHGKSEITSRRTPAFILGKNPDAQIIATSYSADLASSMNRDVQRIVDSREYQQLFPGTQLSGANIRTIAQGTYLRNSDIFEVVGHKGYYLSAGVGGGITGRGGNYMLIDDPLKNRKEANSKTVLKGIWDWFISTFRTRREKDAGMLITMTRWAVGDLAGKLLELMDSPDADQWVVVNFPAIAEDKDIREGKLMPEDIRQAGEALWENKYSREELKTTEFVSGAYEWNSVYQQKPTVSDGTVFKREWFDDAVDASSLPEMVETVRYWDLAMSEKTSADYTVGVKIGKGIDGHYYVLDVARDQIDWSGVPAFMKKTILADGRNVRQGIEQKGYMSRAVKDLNMDIDLHHYTIRGYPKEGDKYTNALPLTAKFSTGVIFLVKGHWNGQYVDEFCAFTPEGGQPHDDQVDATAGAWTMFTENITITASASQYA